MKTQTALFLALLAAAHAGPRTSASYTITTDTTDRGGRRATSAAYTNDGSAGSVTGISTVASPAEVVKHGYLGQFYELATGVFLSATPPTVNEGGTRKIIAARNLDDGTGFPLDPTTVAWSVLGGPIAISASGIATAEFLYQDALANVQGVVESTPLSLPLIVLNVNPDNFYAYGGDGLPDDWQVLYFGLPPNADAGPLVDPDGDGQTNFFEYTAGIVPTDPFSRFTLRLAPVPGEPTHKRVIFHPRLATRSYTVQFRPDLVLGNWMTLTGTTQSDSGLERTVTDLSATGDSKFYRIEITKP